MKIVYFDLDGVLADFVGGAFRRHGREKPQGEIQWDFMTTMGFSGGGDMEFWKPLEDSVFWAGLEPLGDGMDLFARVEKMVGKERIAILSSGLCPGSCDGKRDWLKKHLPGYEKAAIFGTLKGLCASPRHVLVDDFDRNVDEFSLHGRAVMVPRSWNRRRDHACKLTNSFNVTQIFDEISAELE